ncbi:MAG: molybdopterin-synthase adenylyltransferase MoeB [Gammaproteobacteria bacterium]|nr:molybdopterin-synthase adenylyltransferase MoeB [Gammaproteobacteria bacterium]
MDDKQLLRYSRHILLPQVGVDGQQKLLGARVLVIGLGGLGSPVAMYLAASGVGHLVIVDHDRVELSNLQRQIVHTTNTIGKEKVASAQAAMQLLNPDIRVTTFNKTLEADELAEQVKLADAVVDASDNFATRFGLNRLCVEYKKPLVSGAVIRLEGQVTTFRADLPGSACYRCLYQDMDEIAESCSETGVLAPVAGIIGSIQATEALKVLTGVGRTLNGRLLVLDAQTMEWREVKLRKDPACPVCGTA